MSKRLEQRIPDRAQRTEFLTTVHHEAIRAGSDPQLVLALIDIKSGFRKYEISNTGARGYMQVMPFWINLIGEPHHNLFGLRTNLRYGCVILRYYLDLEKGDTFRALGRHNGSAGKSEFSNLVLGAWRGRWAYDGPKF
jgi:soluble lytic murein transglycosylase-like protein